MISINIIYNFSILKFILLISFSLRITQPQIPIAVEIIFKLKNMRKYLYFLIMFVNCKVYI